MCVPCCVGIVVVVLVVGAMCVAYVIVVVVHGVFAFGCA